ncbi:cytochrome P450 [Suillus decipiens]|nr:cytochrome P450 [Suillus decipiens]
MPFTHVLALGISCIIVLVVASKSLTRRRVYPLPLPPGPRPLPIFGNVLQLDSTRPWLTYTAWGKTYGKIIHVSIFGIDLIIINCETTARELLGKRSANYSDRPVMRTRKLAGLDFVTVFLPYGETLRQHRKIFHQVLRAEVSVSYHEMYSHHANKLVLSLLNVTSDLQRQTEIYMSSLIMAVTYGHLADGHEGPLLTRASELAHIAEHILSPERDALFTAFPFLENLPFWCFGGAFALIERSKELSQQLLNEPFNEVKAQMTATTLHAFLLAMVLYPDIQTQARAEIDQAVGYDKMPCLNDRASLPYLDAILLEVLRWHAIIPLGIPHATSNDDVYDGYFIPKGSKLAISRNEDVFPNALRFDPSRHLTVDGKLKDSDPFVNHYGFGRWFAENSLWTAAAAILAVLRIDHAKDSNGHMIEVKPEFGTGMVIHPEPFYCSFESVNTAREEHLRAMMDSK